MRRSPVRSSDYEESTQVMSIERAITSRRIRGASAQRTDIIALRARELFSLLSAAARETLAVLVEQGASNKQLLEIIQGEVPGHQPPAVLWVLRQLTKAAPAAPAAPATVPATATQTVFQGDDSQKLDNLINHSVAREQQLHQVFTYLNEAVQERIHSRGHISKGLLYSLIKVAEAGSKEARTAGALLNLRGTDIESPMIGLQEAPVQLNEKPNGQIVLTINPLPGAENEANAGMRKLPKWQPVLPKATRNESSVSNANRAA